MMFRVRMKHIFFCFRYDIGNLSRDFVVEALTVQNGAIAIVIYLIALILSLSVVDVEDRIHLRYVEPSLWNYTKVSTFFKILQLVIHVHQFTRL